MSLIDTILNAGGGAAVQQLGSQLGLGQDQTTSALTALIPALAAGMHQNAQRPDGLGALIIEYRIEVHYEQMYAALLWSSALSISVFVFFNWLGNRLFSSWHESGAIR